MGKKNKQKKDEAAGGDKKPAQQQASQQPPQGRRPDAQAGTSGQQQSQDQQKGPQREQGQGQQKGSQQQIKDQIPQAGNENVRPQQGAWGGQQQGRPQGGQQQQRQQGGQQQQRPQASDENARPQQGRPQGGQQQQGRPQGGQQQQGRPQGGQQQQGHPQGDQQQDRPQGAWGGGQKQQQPPQQGSSGGGQQQARPQGGQQQGAWGGGQQQARPQGGQQQGAWGGGQQQGRPQGGQQQGRPQSDQQQGAWSGGQQQGRPQGGQQQGAWGGGQQQGRPQGGQQQGRPQGDQQQQPRQQGGAQQQRSSEQQRGPSHQRDQGQQRGPQQRSGDSGYSQQQRGPGPQRGQAPQQQLARLSLSEEQLLPEKAKSCNGIVRGTLGRPGQLEVNYLKLNLDKMPKVAYHYDVSITPDRPKKFLRPAFEQCRLQRFPNVVSVFDGNKSCYTLQRLEASIDHKVEIPDSGNRMKEFQVQIKITDNPEVDLNSLRTYQNESVSDKPMRALQVLEVVLASNNHSRGIRVGRSFFRKPERSFDLTGGFEAWTGLYQAAILGEQPFLNVDIAHKSFPRESTLIDYLRDQDIDPNNDLSQSRWQYNDVQSFLKGIDIVYKPPKEFGATEKKYRVLDIGRPASQLKFRTDDGVEQTVQAYFQSRGVRLYYPNLNCLQVGSTVRSISLPMEFCSIPGGQALNRKDGKKQVEKMIRFAATSTNTRKSKIMDLLDYFEHNENEIVRAFGLTIGANFIKVPSRLLPTPYMEYLQGRTVTTNRGAWRMDGLQFLETSKPANGHKWAIIFEEAKCRRNAYHDLQDFKQNVLKTSKTLNMNLANDAIIDSYHDVNSKLKELHAQKYDLVFVVLADRGTSYAKIKQNAELAVGILTQCIKENTVNRSLRDRTVFSNILLKVNAKLNGTNHKISQDKEMNLKKLMEPIKNVMYLGADVTHPSPDQREIPSVVGSAASHDRFGACYNCQYRLQRSTVENIEDMESIVINHLKVYHKYQNSYPSQIIYYRDGVSDGQFPIVKENEVRGIRSACKKMGCNPKLTVVIVVKRHHTRFFPLTRPRDDRDFNNVEAGTVVDQHITHPNEVQFFMVSHQSIQGTAKPTRYNVIVDDTGFDINLLQKLTYNLCHLFPRCNRAVSYPAPAYLAHLVAFRGRVYIEGTMRFNKNLAIEYEKRIIKPEFMNRNPMYFV